MPLKLVTSTMADPSDVQPHARAPRHPVLTLSWGGLAVPTAAAPARLEIFAGETVLLSGGDRAHRARILRAAAGQSRDDPQPVAPRGIGAALADGPVYYADTPLETVMGCSALDPVAATGLLAMVDLTECADWRVVGLSKLDLRLLRLACACAQSPGALVLDGLFDGLDPQGRKRLVRAFAGLRASRRLGALLTGMDKGPLRPLASRCLELGAAPSVSAPPAIIAERVTAPMPVPMAG